MAAVRDAVLGECKRGRSNIYRGAARIGNGPMHTVWGDLRYEKIRAAAPVDTATSSSSGGGGGGGPLGTRGRDPDPPPQINGGTNRAINSGTPLVRSSDGPAASACRSREVSASLTLSRFASVSPGTLATKIY